MATTDRQIIAQRENPQQEVTRQVITAEMGEVKLGDVLLPGIFQSMEVSGKLRFDEKSVPGSSGARKQPLGYEDASVRLSLKLLTDDKSTCYEKLGELTAVFHGVDDAAKPFVYRIVNRHTSKWNVKEVLFCDLTTSEDNGRDVISAQLAFVEYKPALVEAEAKAAAPPSNSKIVRQADGGNFMGDFKQIERQAVKSEKLASLASPAVDFDDVEDVVNDW